MRIAGNRIYFKDILILIFSPMLFVIALFKMMGFGIRFVIGGVHEFMGQELMPFLAEPYTSPRGAEFCKECEQVWLIDRLLVPLTTSRGWINVGLGFLFGLAMVISIIPLLLFAVLSKLGEFLIKDIKSERAWNKERRKPKIIEEYETTFLRKRI